MIDPVLLNAISGAALGGIGGAIGAGLGSVLKKRTGPSRLTRLFPVICVALALGLSPLATPALSAYLGSSEDQLASSMAALERDVPAFAAMRIHEPEAYEHVRATLGNGLAHGTPYNQLVNEVRAIISAIYLKKLPSMESELVLASASITAEQGRVLAKANPDTCIAWLNGQGGDISPHLSPELQQKEWELLDRVIRGAPLETPEVATFDEFAASMPAILDALAARTNLSIETVNAAMDGVGSSADICLVRSGFLGAIGELPGGQGVPLLRMVLAFEESHD